MVFEFNEAAKFVRRQNHKRGFNTKSQSRHDKEMPKNLGLCRCQKWLFFLVLIVVLVLENPVKRGRERRRGLANFCQVHNSISEVITGLFIASPPFFPASSGAFYKSLHTSQPSLPGAEGEFFGLGFAMLANGNLLPPHHAHFRAPGCHPILAPGFDAAINDRCTPTMPDRPLRRTISAAYCRAIRTGVPNLAAKVSRWVCAAANA